MRELLFLELIHFVAKIIPKKSRIISWSPKALKIRGKFPKTLWNMRNPNKVFGAHKILLRTWNIKIKVNEVEIKFQKEARKFLEIDIRLLNVYKKTHILHIETPGATGMNATNMFLPCDKF